MCSHKRARVSLGRRIFETTSRPIGTEATARNPWLPSSHQGSLLNRVMDGVPSGGQLDGGRRGEGKEGVRARARSGIEGRGTRDSEASLRRLSR